MSKPTRLGAHLSYELVPNQQHGSRLANPLFDVLNAVRESGSIGRAAQALDCSYRYVWGALRQWEATLGEPLIVRSRGQRAQLTPFAERLLWAERRARARMQPHIEALRADLGRLIDDALDEQQQGLTVFASHDLALPLLQQHAARHAALHLDIRFRGSVDSLRALNTGRCMVAGFHVPALQGAAPLFAAAMKPLLKPGLHKLIGCARRRQGLMLRREHAGRVQSMADLADAPLRFVNRQPGSGTRLMVDHLMQQQAIDPARLPGYHDRIEETHVAVAACIASGLADAGPGIEAAALAFGLHFVPLLDEDYFLACLKPNLGHPAVLRLRALLEAPGWNTLLDGLAGYSPAAAPGQVLVMTAALPWWRYARAKAPSRSAGATA